LETIAGPLPQMPVLFVKSRLGKKAHLLSEPIKLEPPPFVK